MPHFSFVFHLALGWLIRYLPSQEEGRDQLSFRLGVNPNHPFGFYDVSLSGDLARLFRKANFRQNDRLAVLLRDLEVARDPLEKGRVAFGLKASGRRYWDLRPKTGKIPTADLRLNPGYLSYGLGDYLGADNFFVNNDALNNPLLTATKPATDPIAMPPKSLKKPKRRFIYSSKSYSCRESDPYPCPDRDEEDDLSPSPRYDEEDDLNDESLEEKRNDSYIYDEIMYDLGLIGFDEDFFDKMKLGNFWDDEYFNDDNLVDEGDEDLEDEDDEDLEDEDDEDLEDEDDEDLEDEDDEDLEDEDEESEDGTLSVLFTPERRGRKFRPLNRSRRLVKAILKEKTPRSSKDMALPDLVRSLFFILEKNNFKYPPFKARNLKFKGFPRKRESQTRNHLDWRAFLNGLTFEELVDFAIKLRDTVRARH